jgi:hypothetical protein
VSYREFYEHLTEVGSIPGVVGDTTAPNNVNTKELSIGVQVEIEHTNDDKIAEKAEELRALLRQEGIAFQDNLIYMGYNAPWDFIGRRNEVAFEIK